MRAQNQQGEATDDVDPSARLEALRTTQLHLHRLEPPRPLRGPKRTSSWVRERRIVVVSGRGGGLPALAEAIAGQRIRGSWWGHPDGHRIYGLLGRLDDDLIGLTLVLGKTTVLDPSLGPALQRVATDPARRQRARDGLPPLAREILDRTEVDGEVRMDALDVPARRSRPARITLEQQLLVVSREEHTDRGHHVSTVYPWEASVLPKRFGPAAKRLSYEEARDALLLAAVRSAVVAKERDARRWFAFDVGDRIEALSERGDLDRFSAEGSTWLTVGRPVRPGVSRATGSTGQA